MRFNNYKYKNSEKFYKSPAFNPIILCVNYIQFYKGEVIDFTDTQFKRKGFWD